MFHPLYSYWARIDRVVDGDTFHATVDVGFGISLQHTFRVSGYDAPETYRPRSPEERAHGERASQEARRLLFGANRVLTTERDRSGKYGRYLADVLVPQDLLLREPWSEKLERFRPLGAEGPVGVSLAQYLSAAGLAKRENY